jgi:membrane protein implicated in regulation of membrane protease activity
VLTLVFLFLLIAIAGGIFGVMAAGTAGQVVFFVFLLASVVAAMLHMRERRRWPRL